MCEPRAHCSTSSDGGCNGGMENEVKNIIDKQFVDGEPEYLVEWKHCPRDTWEPKSNLGNCSELVAEYEGKWMGSKALQLNTKRFSTIEKILERRTVNGQREYRVKWKGCNESRSTWEPKESFPTPELINEFEKEERKKNGRNTRIWKPTAKNSKKGATRSATEVARGRRSEATKRNAETRSASPSNTRRLSDPVAPEKRTRRAMPASPQSSSGGSDNEVVDEPEKILNATDASGHLQYLVSYKGGKQLRRVPADEIHAQSPQVALAYYLERRAWEIPI